MHCSWAPGLARRSLLLPNGNGGHAHDGGVGRNILYHQRVGGDRYVVADLYSADNLGSGIDGDVVAYDWPAALSRIDVADGDLLVDPAVGTNPVGHNERAIAMDDEKPRPNFNSGKDLQRRQWSAQN